MQDVVGYVLDEDLSPLPPEKIVLEMDTETTECASIMASGDLLKGNYPEKIPYVMIEWYYNNNKEEEEEGYSSRYCTVARVCVYGLNVCTLYAYWLVPLFCPFDGLLSPSISIKYAQD